MAGETQRIGILGTGSWGATLASLLSKSDHAVTVWTRDARKAEFINSEHRIEQPIAITFADSVRATEQLSKFASQCEIIIFCCPSQAVREMAVQLKPLLATRNGMTPVLVSAVKG